MGMNSRNVGSVCGHIGNMMYKCVILQKGLNCVEIAAGRNGNSVEIEGILHVEGHNIVACILYNGKRMLQRGGALCC